MMHFVRRKRSRCAARIVSAVILVTFTVNLVIPPQVLAQTAVKVQPVLPAAVPVIMPPVLSGLTVLPENPLQFDFIVDKGRQDISEAQLKDESTKLIKYFLASVTIPDDNQWVNLSPYEKERIIPEDFGSTEMGRDLLLQDYFLKQFTSALNNPEHELGRQFWKRVQDKAYKMFGTRDIPLSTFNKVWIVPEKAVIFEKDNTAFILESRLKVMLEEDQLSLNSNAKNQNITPEQLKQVSKVSSQIMKEVIVPEIEKEVNTGKTFVNLRQIYNSMILATWYKESLKESLLNQVYANNSKLKGIDLEDKQAKQKIYQQYLDAFKKGAYNVIKEEYDPEMDETIYRKYVSGGITKQGIGAFKNLGAMIREQIVRNAAAIPPAQLDKLLDDEGPTQPHVRERIELIENLKEPPSAPAVTQPETSEMILANPAEKGLWLKTITSLIRQLNQARFDTRVHSLILWEKRKYGSDLVIPVKDGRLDIEANEEFSRMMKIYGGLFANVSGLEGTVTFEEEEKTPEGSMVQRDRSTKISSFRLVDLLTSSAVFERLKGKNELKIVEIGVRFSEHADLAENDLRRNTSNNHTILSRRLESYLYSLLREVMDIPSPGSERIALQLNLDDKILSNRLFGVNRLLTDLALAKGPDGKQRFIVWDSTKKNGDTRWTWDQFAAGYFFAQEAAQQLGLTAESTQINGKAAIVMEIPPARRSKLSTENLGELQENIRAVFQKRLAVLNGMASIVKDIVAPLEIDDAGDDAADAAMMAALPDMTVQNGLASIRINNRTLDRGDVDELIKFVDQVADGTHGVVKGIVLTGGDHLSFGANIYDLLKDGMSDDAETRKKPYEFYRREEALGRKIKALSGKGIPTVVLARGLTVGGGLGLSAAADFIITDGSSRLSMPEVKIGFFPDVGATWFLANRMGIAAAKYYALTGGSLSGTEAVGMGLAQGYVSDMAAFQKKLEQFLQSGAPVNKQVIEQLIKDSGKTQDDLQGDVAALKAKLAQYFNFGQHNQGTVADIYATLEKDANAGDTFAQTALAQMRSAAPASIWLTDFLLDTFQQDKFKNDPAAARNLEVQFAGDMTTSIWYMEGVSGLKQDQPYVSGKFSSHLDRIVLSDGVGFRTELKADNIETGSALKTDQVITFNGKEYVVPQGNYHAGQKTITLKEKGTAAAVTLNIALRNSQWSDQARTDKLHVIETMSQTIAGFNILRRASLLNQNKVILDLVSRMPWFKRPHTAIERPENEDPRTRRFIGGELNASYMALDYWVEQGQGSRVIAIEEGDEVDGAGEPKEIIPVTYNKLLMEAKKMANALKKQGLKKGDTVVLYMPNSWQTLVAMQACTRLGVIYHPVFAAKKRDVLSDILYELGAKHLITVDAYSVKGNLMQLKRDNVDPVLNEYLSREEFMARAEKALNGQDARVAEAVRDELQGNAEKKINGIIPEKSTVTQDRRKVIEALTKKQTEQPELAGAINLVIDAFNAPITRRVEKVIVLEKGGPKTRAEYMEGRDVKWSEFVAGQEDAMRDAVQEIAGSRPSSMDDVISGKTSLTSEQISRVILQYNSPLERVEANMPLAVLYTSGTTGKPKGPVITHGNIAAAMAEFPITGQASPEDMFFVAADVGWVTGLVYLGNIPLGNNVPFLIPGFPYSDIERIARLIERYNVTIFKAGAGILANMAKNPDIFKKYKHDTVKLFISCAAVLSNSSYKQFITLFGKKLGIDLWRTEEEGMKALKVFRDLLIEAASVAGNRQALSKILNRDVSEKEMQDIVARLRAGYEIGENRVEILDLPWVSIRFFEAKNEDGDPLPEVREVTETHKVAIDPVTNQPIVDANGNPKMVEDGASVFYEADMMAAHAMGSVWKTRRGQKRDGSKPYDVEEDVDLPVLTAKYFIYPQVVAEDGRVMHYTGDAATPTRFLEDPLNPGERLGVMYQPNGRDDDVMNINGHRVSSTDMEDPLKAFSEFEEVAVVGVRREGDPRGDSPVVIIKLKKGFQDSPALRQKILTTIGDAIDEQVKPLESDIAFIPSDEAGIPFTLTGKPMNSLLKYIGRKTTDELRILNLGLQDKTIQDKVLAVDVDTLQRLMPGLRNVDTLANPGSFLSVPKAILAARDRQAVTEGALPLDRTIAVSDPYANVAKGVVAKFGEKSLRPGIDPLPDFQDAIVLPRNLDGVTMRGEPKDGLKVMEIPVPEPGPNQIVGQVLFADATYNTINGVTEEPVPVIKPNAPYHGFGDSAIILVEALGSEVDKEGRIAVGDLIVVDPSRYNLLDVKDPKEAGYGILGFNVGDGTFRRHVVLDANKAHFPPRGLTLAQNATLALNGGTAFKAVDDVLDVQAGDMVKVDGLIATTGEQSGAIADMSGAGVIGFVGDAAKAAQSKTNHPTWIPIIRRDVGQLLRKAPRDAEGRRQWLADFAEYIRRVYTEPGVPRPTKSVGFIGAPHFSLAVRELLPGGSHAWFSGAFGLDGTLVGHNAEVTAQEAFTRAGLKAGQNVLIHYGADADENGTDQKALEAIREAGRRGARIVVLAETAKQQARALELASDIIETRIVNIEDLKGSGLEWPAHMPDVDEGRMDKTRPASQPWAGLDKQKKYEDKTLKVIGKALGEFIKGYDNPNGYFDVIWDNGKRDNLGVSIFVVREQTGVIVYGKTTEDQTLTFSLARGWFPEKGIYLPSSPADLQQIPSPTLEQRFVGILGTHMYEAEHLARMIKLIDQGALKWPQPARIVPAVEIPKATQEQWLGEKAGATVYQMTSDITPDMTTPRQIMLAQGRELVFEGKYVRMILDEVEPGRKIATIEFFKAEDVLRNPRGEWNKMLHTFEQDAVKELKILVDRIKKSTDIKGILLTNYGTRAFLAGQDIKQLQRTPDAQTVEKLALEAQGIFADLENLAKDDKPVIWVPNGLALGGGMELGSAAHYSIAVDTTKNLTDPGRIYFSQAEVGLNALPGFGGTQRWVREAYQHAQETTGNGLAGFQFAADSVMNGQPISVREAAQHGLISEVVEANAIPRAYALLRGHINGTDNTLHKAMQRRMELVGSWDLPMTDVPADYFANDPYFNQVIVPQAKKAGRSMAIDAMRRLLEENARKGVQFAAEAKEFGRLMKDPNAGVIGIARELAKQKPELPPKRAESGILSLNSLVQAIRRDISGGTTRSVSQPKPGTPLGVVEPSTTQDEPARPVRKQRQAPSPEERFSAIDLLGTLTDDEVAIARETAHTFIDNDTAKKYGLVNDVNSRVDSTDEFINLIDPENELRDLAAAEGLSVEIVGLNFSFERAQKIAQVQGKTTHQSSVIMLDRDMRKNMRLFISNTELFLLRNTSKPAREQMAKVIKARFEIALAEKSLAEEQAAAMPSLEVFRKSYAEVKRQQELKRAQQPPGLHKGKIVLVSGAAGEMGTDLAQRLLDEGATVIFTGRTLATLNGKIADFKAQGYDISRMRAIAIDNTNPEKVREGIEKVRAEYGRIDSLLIVAGTTGPVSPLITSPVGTDKDENIQQGVRNLFVGDILLATEASKIMGAGSSINVVSTIFSRTDYHSRIGYVTPKSALRPFFEALGRDLGQQKGIRVNLIYPGGLFGDRIKKAWRVMDANRGSQPGSVATEFFNTMRINENYPTFRDVTSAIIWSLGDEASGIANQNIEATNGMDIEVESATSLFEHLDISGIRNDGEVIMLWGGADLKMLEEVIARYIKTFPKRILVNVANDEALTKLQSNLRAKGLWDSTLIQLAVHRADDPVAVTSIFEDTEKRYQRADTVVYMPQFSMPAAQWNDVQNPNDWIKFGDQHVTAPILIARQAMISSAKADNEKAEMKMAFIAPALSNELAASSVAGVEALVRNIRHEEDRSVHNERKEIPIKPYQLITNGQAEDMDVVLDHLVALTAKEAEQRISFDEINLYGPQARESYRQVLLDRDMEPVDPAKEQSFQKSAEDLKARQEAQVIFTAGKRMKDKRAVITGAAGEIGREVTRRYLQEGAQVVLIGRDLEKLQIFKQDLLTDGYASDSIQIVGMDLSRPDEIMRGVGEIAKLGNVDILVNNAGTAGPREGLEDLPFDEYDGENMPQALTNLFAGTWMLTQELVPHMNQNGSVVNVSSIFSLLEYYARIGYTVPKGALNGFSQELAWELGRSKNIRVNTIYPGPIDTQRIRNVFDAMSRKIGISADVLRDHFFKMMAINKGFPKKDEVANMAVFLGSDDSGAISGQNFDVTNGMLVDRQDRVTLKDRPTPAREFASPVQTTTVFGRTYQHPDINITENLSGKKIVVVGKVREQALDHLVRQLSDKGAVVSVVPPETFDDRVRAAEIAKLEGAYAVIYAHQADDLPDGSLLDIPQSRRSEFLEQSILRMLYFSKLTSGILRNVAHSDRLIPKVIFLSPRKKSNYAAILNSAAESLVRQMRHDQDIETLRTDAQEKNLTAEYYHVVSTEDDSVEGRTDWVEYLLTDYAGKPEAVSLYQQDAARRVHEPRGTAKTTVKPGKTMLEYYREFEEANFILKDIPGMDGTPGIRGAMVNEDGSRKVILITGGSRGIGKATILAWLLAGGRIGFFARNLDDMKENIAELKAIPEFAQFTDEQLADRIMAVSGTIESEDDNERFVRKVVEKWGRIDHLINNAGATGPTAPVVRVKPGINKKLIDIKRKIGGIYADLDDEILARFPGNEGIDALAYEDTFNGNVTAALMLSRAALPYLEKTQGKIINISTYFSDTRYPFRAPYSMAKAAMDALNDILRAEAMNLGLKHVQIASVHPSSVEGTRLQAIKDKAGSWVGLFEARAEASRESGIAVTAEDIDRKTREMFLEKDEAGIGMFPTEAEIAQAIYDVALSRAHTHKRVYPDRGFDDGRVVVDNNLDTALAEYVNEKNISGKVVLISGEVFEPGLRNSIKFLAEKGARVIVYTQTKAAADTLIRLFSDVTIGKGGSMVIENRGELKLRAGAKKVGETRFNEIIKGGVRTEGSEFVRMVKEAGASGFTRHIGEFAGTEKLDIVISAPLHKLPQRSILDVKNFGTPQDATMSIDEFKRMLREQVIAHAIIARTGIDQILETSRGGAFFIVGPSTDSKTPFMERMNAVFVNKVLRQFVLSLEGELSGRKAPVKVNSLTLASPSAAKEYSEDNRRVQDELILTTVLNNVLGKIDYSTPEAAARAVFHTGKIYVKDSSVTVSNGKKGKSGDSAMMAGDAAGTTDVGGIKLDSKLLDLQIKRDGNGVPLPMNLQPLQNMNIQGFAPVILNIQPVNVRLILGLADQPADGSDYSLDAKPQPYIKKEKQDLSLAR